MHDGVLDFAKEDNDKQDIKAFKMLLIKEGKIKIKIDINSLILIRPAEGMN